MNKNRKWSEEEIRALTHGEANDYASRGQHYYVDKAVSYTHLTLPTKA